MYGLSGRRVLILQDGARRQLRSLELSALGDLHLSERKDGRGTIGFGPVFYGAIYAVSGVLFWRAFPPRGTC